jgi:FkbH-like protein
VAAPALSEPSAGWSLDIDVIRAVNSARLKLPLLRALAATDAAAALAWLQHAGAEGGQPFSVQEIAGVLDEIAQAAAAARDVDIASTVVNAFTHHPDYASAGALKAVAPLLDPDTRVRQCAPLAERLLTKTPSDQDLLRLCAEAALEFEDDSRAQILLARLSEATTTPAAAQQVERMYARLSDAALPTIKIAVLSSFTIEPLRPFLTIGCRALGARPAVYIGGYQAWERELCNPESGYYAFAPDVLFLFLSVDDLIPTLATGVSSDSELEAAGEAALQRVLQSVRSCRSLSDCAIVVHTFRTIYGGATARVYGRSAHAWVRNLNTRLIEQLDQLSDTYILETDLIFAQARCAADDPKLRHLARMRLPLEALSETSKAYVRFIAGWKGITRKCVVLDLDNTLWGGVIGEDGLTGIRLSGSAAGSEYVEFQQYLKGLIGQGFLLALASKNNEADALEVLRTHDAMVLREHDFVATRINWRPKPENIRSIAAELGIGLDSMVFVDDNADERELMRQLAPDVLTVELPSDATLYRTTLERLPQLQVVRLTDEDRQRTQRYHEKQRREVSRAKAGSFEDFLTSLELTAHIALASAADVARVYQLFQRTNQFNLTTRRYENAVLDACRSDPAVRLYTLRYRDRFSEPELVGAALVTAAADRWHVDNLVLSCRAIGYGIESALLARICTDARQSGVVIIGGDFIPTVKNQPAREFYALHGFELAAREADLEIWRRGLADVPASPHWIRLDRI